jgi:hypothetical protein
MSGSRSVPIIGSDRITYLCGLLLVLVGIALMAPSDSLAVGPSKWTLQNTLNPGNLNSLSDVECPTSTECIAVGARDNEGPISQRWSGGSWSSLSNATTAQLTDLSCASSSSCIAISTTLKAERWTGSEWKSATASTPAESFTSNLYSVSCSSSTFCLAVGTYTLEKGAKSRTLVEEWNGEKWTILSSPFEEGGTNALYAVSCPSSTTCTAIGLKGGKAIALRWSGSEWTTLGEFKETPNTLADISCTGANYCYAVPGGTAKLELWNATLKWSTATVPTPEGGSGVSLRSVSCLAGPKCKAVGSYVKEGKTLSYAAKLSILTTWSLEATPNFDGVGVLSGVDCAAESNCMAAGYAQPGIAWASRTVAERYGSSPVATTGEGVKLGATEFKITGSVNPEGISTSYYFEYGTTTSYGNKIPLAGESVGSGTENIAVEQKLTSLKTNTTYHFRIVAYTSGDIVYGNDQPFTVPSATRYWYVGGEKLAPSTPTELLANGTTNFALQWNPGWNYDITCTTLKSEKGTIENPAKEAAGSGSVNLLLSGCTVKSPAKCTVYPNPLPFEVNALATEYEGLSAVKFSGKWTEEAVATLTLEGSECPLKGSTYLIRGSFIGIATGASSFEFTNATSNLRVGLSPVNFSGTAKTETKAGKAVTVKP